MESSSPECLFDLLDDDVLSVIYSFFRPQEVLSLRLVSRDHFKPHVEKIVTCFKLGPFASDLPSISLQSMLVNFSKLEEIQFHQIDLLSGGRLLEEFINGKTG
mmetsp:Transcript_17945/g.20368  ORF Transcript_17945/g.20368 Transcript_17945/m.20368 type:complete len:103 (-) Transcript_17945:81-389(-)